MSWKIKTVSEFTKGTTIWRAQLSVAPDGKKFRGIRKFAIKKDGSEVVTSTGISIPATDKDEIRSIIKLLEALL